MEEMKRCPRCGEEKPLEEFYKTGSYCKPCFREYDRVRRQSPWVRARNRELQNRRYKEDAEFREKESAIKRQRYWTPERVAAAEARKVERQKLIALEAAGWKRCSKCGELKPVEDFHLKGDLASWSKYQPQCKACRCPVVAKKMREAYAERMLGAPRRRENKRST